jgi:plasmid maintenance system antidote protein VapI
MTTLTIDKNIKLDKTNFDNIEELYLNLQEKLTFESNLQKKAQE